ncbi:hypothetical protein ACFLRF_06290, partial [Candidatus Altiarchaeota archaeon]
PMHERLDENMRASAFLAWGKMAAANPGDPEILSHIGKVAEAFSDEAGPVRCYSLQAYGDAVKANPGNEQVLGHLPKMVGNFDDTASMARDNAMAVWEAAAELNPGHRLVEQTRRAYERAKDAGG